MAVDTDYIMPTSHAIDTSSPTRRRLDTVLGISTPARRRKRTRIGKLITRQI